MRINHKTGDFEFQRERRREHDQGFVIFLDMNGLN